MDCNYYVTEKIEMNTVHKKRGERTKSIIPVVYLLGYFENVIVTMRYGRAQNKNPTIKRTKRDLRTKPIGALRKQAQKENKFIITSSYTQYTYVL